MVRSHLGYTGYDRDFAALFKDKNNLLFVISCRTAAGESGIIIVIEQHSSY